MVRELFLTINHHALAQTRGGWITYNLGAMADQVRNIRFSYKKFLNLLTKTITHELTHKLIEEFGYSQPENDYAGEESICVMMEN